MFWCLGMFSSASTWTFNVVHKVALAFAPEQPPVPVFLDVSDALPDCDGARGALIVKTHGTEIARELGRRAEAVIITIRDPRDAVVSLMRHHRVPFDIALRMTEVSARTCSHFRTHRRSALLRFEDRFLTILERSIALPQCFRACFLPVKAAAYSIRCGGMRSMRSLQGWTCYPQH
jgi:hypothetical protein